ncbi:hypothetical protein B5M09_012438, partial [Aphanomyces astaci]
VKVGGKTDGFSGVSVRVDVTVTVNKNDEVGRAANGLNTAWATYVGVHESEVGVGAEDGLRGEGFSTRLRVLTDVAVEGFEVPCAIAGDLGVVGNERAEDGGTGVAKAFVPSSKKGIVGQTRDVN